MRQRTLLTAGVLLVIVFLLTTIDDVSAATRRRRSTFIILYTDVTLIQKVVAKFPRQGDRFCLGGKNSRFSTHIF